MNVFNKGLQVWFLPFSQEVWQIALFVIGHEKWTADDEDHQEPYYITWYIQFLMWQVSYTRELDD